jgi:hypothetical protein
LPIGVREIVPEVWKKPATYLLAVKPAASLTLADVPPPAGLSVHDCASPSLPDMVPGRFVFITVYAMQEVLGHPGFLNLLITGLACALSDLSMWATIAILLAINRRSRYEDGANDPG